MQYDEPVYFLPPATVNRAPCLFPGFFRLFPLFVGLYHRFHLFRAKGSLDPLIVGGDLPQGLVFQLDLLQCVRRSKSAA